MYRLTICIRSDDTIRPNTYTLFGPLFGTEANTKRTFGASLVDGAKDVHVESVGDCATAAAKLLLPNVLSLRGTEHLLSGVDL